MRLTLSGREEAGAKDLGEGARDRQWRKRPLEILRTEPSRSGVAKERWTPSSSRHLLLFPAIFFTLAFRFAYISLSFATPSLKHDHHYNHPPV